MKKILLSLFLILSLVTLAFAGVTNFDSLTLGDNLVVGGTATITGATSLTGTLSVQNLIVDDFIEYDPAATVDTSATTDATITPLGSYQLIDTWNDQAVSTVNAIVTTNIANGTIVFFQTTNSTHDVVFIETDNLDVSGNAQTLDKNLDIIGFIKSGSNQWIELHFSDNN